MTAILALLALAAARSAAAAVVEVTAVTPALPYAAPRDVATADVDEDGAADALTAWTGNSTLTWTSAKTGATSELSGAVLDGDVRAVAVGDVNGDGHVDVAGGAAVFSGAGDGTFELLASPVASACAPRGIAMGDVTGDGFDDVVYACDSNDVVVARGPWCNETVAVAALSGLGSPRHLALGDVDSDGDIDIVVPLNADGAVTWALNNGTGGFAAGPTVGGIAGAHRVALADVDGDGDLDVVCATDADEVVLIRGTGTDVEVIAPQGRGLALADLDLDGDVDIVSGSQWLANNGTGGFTTSHDLSLAQQQVVYAIAAGDMDGDGDADLAAADADALNLLTVETVPFAPSGLVVVALDGAAFLSWTAADGNGANVTEYIVQPGDAATTTTTTATIDGLTNGVSYANYTVAASSSRGTGPAAAVPEFTPRRAIDVDVHGASGNGPVDVAITSDGQTIAAWSDSVTVVGVARLSDGIMAPRFVATGDVNGDGSADVVVTDGNAGTVTLWLGDGASWFEPATVVSPGGDPRGLAVADVTGDGLDDVVVALLDADELHLWAGNTTETVAVATGLAQPINVELGDMDNDGDLDIVAVSREDDLLVWLRNDGSGTFEPWKSLPAPAAPSRLDLGDVDGDGTLDIVVCGADTDEVWLVSNNGTTTTPVLSSQSSPRGVALADLDLDGDLDLIAVSTGDDDTVAWYANSGTGGVFASTQLLATADGARNVAVGDVDGDGDDDFAVVAGTASTVYTFTVNTVPLAPSQLEVVPLDGAVYLWWSAADANGDDAGVTQYVINDGAYNATTTTSTTIDGLANLDTYDFWVRGVNGFGVGVASQVVSATPLEAVVVAATTVVPNGEALANCAGDIDGDGADDVLVSWTGGDVTWTTHTSTTSLPNATSILVQPYRVALGDVNGDGFLDAAVADPTEDVVAVWLWVADDGAFELFSVAAFADTDDPRGVAIGDVTGDGVADVVYAADEVGYLLLSSNGTAEAVPVAAESGVDNPYAVTLVDLDNDGRFNIVLVNTGSDDVVWFHSDGSVAQSLPVTPTEVAAADVDGNGWTDLAVTSSADGNVWLLRNTDGVLGDAELVSDAHEGPRGVAFADMDMDGDADIIVSTYFVKQRIAWHVNDGSGVFVPTPQFLSTDHGGSTLAAADVDGDGDADVAVPAFNGGAVLLTVETVPLLPASSCSIIMMDTAVILSWGAADGNGANVTQYVVEPGGYTTAATVTTLFVGDLTTGASYDFSVAALSTRGSSFPAAFPPSVPFRAVDVAVSVAEDSYNTPREVTLADVDSDGVLDAVAAWSGSDLVAWTSGRTGVTTPFDTAVPRAYGVAAGDVDGDGLVDVVGTAYTAAQLVVFLGNGSVALVVADFTNPIGVALGDVTGDGVDDIVFTTNGGDCGLHVFTANTTTTVLFNSGSTAYYPELADVDSDGHLDIAVPSGKGLAWARNDGVGGFVVAQSVTGMTATHVALGDIDGDGDVDAAVAAPTDNTVWLCRNTNSSFEEPTVLSDSWRIQYDVVMADMDLDGDLDIVMASYQDNLVEWYANHDGLGTFLPGQLLGSGDTPDPWAIAAGDVDADGDADLVVASYAGSLLWLTVSTVPMAPTSPVAIPMDSAVFLSWSASDPNGDAVTEYVINNGYATTEGDTSITIDGLTNGVAHADFTVAATSGRGTGPSTTFPAATPRRAVDVAAVIALAVSGSTMALGDVDSDGVLDTVVAGFQSGQVTWTSGATESTTVLGAADGPCSVAVCDVDADGLLDVVVAALNGSEVVVFLGNSTTTTMATQRATSVACADVTGDGVDDVVYATDQHMALADIDADGALDLVTSAEWARNDGEGGFAVAQSLAGTGDAIAVADIDGDGDVDVALGTSLLYRNNGSALVAEPGPAASSSSSPPLFADLDNDGDEDLIAGASWFANAGSGVFAPAQSLENGTVAGAAGDLDGDGDLDIAAFADGDSLAWLLVSTVPPPPSVVSAIPMDSAVFLSWSASDPNGDAVTEYVINNGYATTEGDTSITIDGLTNGVTYADFTVAASSSRGTGPASDAVDVTPRNAVNVTVVAGGARDGGSNAVDIAAYGDRVLVAWNTDSRLTWTDAADGSTTTLTSDISGAYGVAVGHLDDDGLVDVAAAANGTGEILVFLGNGTRVVAATLVGSLDVAIGDVTGDGSDDLVFSGSDTVAYVANLGDEPTTVLAASGFVTLADVDSDGDTDVLVGGTWARNDGAGGFQLAQTLADGCERAAAGDTGVLLVCHDGLFTSNGSALFSGAVSDAAFVDVDLDGDEDVVAALQGNDSVVWFAADGAGTFAPAQTLVSGLGGRAIAVSDFDGDGDDDLAVCTDSNVELLFVSTVPFAPTNVSIDGATVSWSAAPDNGAAVTAHVVLAGDSTWSGNASATLTLVGGGVDVLGNVTVRGVNERGEGLWSSPPVAYDSCADGVVSGTETDADCGGLACDRCAPDAQCAEDSDCDNGECDPITGRCASCLDGVQNQDETGVDCGGLACAPCLTCTPVDYGVEVQWDAVPGNGSYTLNSDLVTTTATAVNLTDLPNHVPVSLSLLAASSGLTANCTATPTPPTVLGDPWTLDEVVGDQAALGNVRGSAAADLIVLAASGDELDVYLGPDLDVLDGDALVSLAATATALTAGDVDGDGVVDLLVVPTGGAALDLYRGPDFDVRESVDVPTAVSAVAVSPDDGSIYVLTADTGDVVQLNGEPVLSPSQPATGLAMCDIDNDGDVDLVLGAPVYLRDSNNNYGLADDDYSLAGSSPACVAREAVVVDALTAYPLQSHPEPPAAAPTVSPASLTSVNVSWTASVVDGGATVTSYAVSTTTATTTAKLSAVIADLESRAVYSFAVRATNEVGDSAWSDATTYVAPALDANATRLPAGQMLLNWTYGDLRAEINGEAVAGAPPVVVDTPECRPYELTVVVFDAANASSLSASVVTQVPLGVCAGACAADNDSTVVDPTQLDPFAIAACNGSSWTWLDPALSTARKQALSAISTHTRFADRGLELDVPLFAVAPGTNCSTADGEPYTVTEADYERDDVFVTTRLDTALTDPLPDAWVSTPVNVSTDIGMLSNCPAAQFEVELSTAYAVEGEHTARVRAVVDPWFFDSTPVSVSWTYDATPPTTDLQPRPALHSPLASGAFGLSATEVVTKFDYCFDGGAVCGIVAGGTNDTSAAEPVTTLESAPTNPYASGSVVEVDVSSSSADVSLSLAKDYGAWAAAGGAPLTVAGLDDGWHALHVRAVDAATGAEDSTPEAVGVFVGDDFVAPNTYLAVSGLDAGNNIVLGAHLELNVSASEPGCAFQFSRDLGESWASSFNATTLTAVVGVFSLLAVAIDAAGNADPVPAFAAWQVTPPPEPDTFLWSAVGATTVELTFNASEPDCSFEISTDVGQTWTSATSPLELADLAVGQYAVHVRAVDWTGQADSTPAAVTWQVIAEPETTLERVGEGELTASSPTADVTFEYSTDLGATWSDMDGDSLSFSQLGLYHVLVRAVDSAGHVDPTPAVEMWQIAQPAAPELNLTDCAECEYSLDFGETWTETEPTVVETTTVALVRAQGYDEIAAVEPLQVIDAPVVELLLRPPAQSAFSVSVFAASIVHADCTLPFVLTRDGAVVAEGEADDDGVIVVGPFDFGDSLFALAVDAECDGVASTSAATHEWTIIAEDSSIVASYDGLADGAHSVAAWATDLAGNVGPNVTYEWTVDTVAPDTELVVGGEEVTTESTFVFNASCSEEACTLDVVCDANVDVDVDVDGGTVTLAELGEGAYVVAVAAVDLAGNVDPTPANFSLLVDTTPPDVRATAIAGWVTNTPRVLVSCEDISGCDSVSWSCGSSSGSGTGIVDLVLDDGVYEFVAVAVDGVSNTASVARNLTVDTGAPETVVYSALSYGELNATCIDKRSRCWLNASIPLTGMRDGLYSDVAVWAVDEAGNFDATPELVDLLVDGTPPVLHNVTTTYSAGGGTAWFEIGCSDATTCEPVPASFAADADGNFSVVVGAIDAGSNLAEEALSVVVVLDRLPPEVSVVAAPTYTAASEVAVEWTAVDATTAAACECNGSPCAPPLVNVSATGDRDVTLAIACTDERGHTGRANATWRVDQVAPALSLNTSSSTNAAEVWTIPFSVADSTPVVAECSVAGVSAAEPCAPPVWNTSSVGLADGEYTITIEATDAVGNVAQAQQLLAFDTEPPTLEVAQQPAAVVTDTAVTVEFGCVLTASTECTEAVVDPDCSLFFAFDGTTGTGGVVELTGLVAEGEYALDVFGVDAAGNVARQTVTWTRSDEAISPTIESGPAATSGVTWATFTWSTSVGAYAATDFVYKLDAGDWEDVEGVNKTLTVTGLAASTHTFSVALRGGEASAAQAVWEVADSCPTTDEVMWLGENNARECAPCPAGIDCTGRPDPGILPGWWWSAAGNATVTGSADLYQCRVEDACEGGQCRPGYEGVACDVCSESFGKSLQLTCEPCNGADNASIVVLAATLFSLGLTVVAVFVVKKSISTDSSGRALSTLKIMANYFLMMGILKDMDLDWGGMLRTLFAYMGVASGNGAADVQVVNCVARVDTFDQFRLYFSIPALLVVGPAVAIWGYAGVRRLAWHANGRPGGTLGSARIFGHSKAFVYRQSLLVLSYFAYPVVVTNSFRVLHCTEIEGAQLLVEDYSKPCSGSEYNALFVVGALFASVVAFGVPGAIVVAMARRKESLGDSGGKARSQFFFFFGEFKMEWYWWEVTVMARKVAMGAIAVLLNNHAQKMQVYVGTWLLLLSFTAQITCSPHRDALQRNLEAAAQGTVLASLLLGQGMAFNGVLGWQTDVFQACVLALNVVAMSGMGLTLGREIWVEAKEKGVIAKLRPRVTKALELPSMSASGGAAQAFTSENPMWQKKAQANRDRRRSADDGALPAGGPWIRWVAHA